MSPRLNLTPLLLAGALGGCGLDWTSNGTAVGNPTDMAVHAAPSEGSSFTEAKTKVSTLSLATCAGETSVRTLEDDVDLLGRTALELPGGAWCSFTLTFAEPLGFSGQLQDGGEFAFSLVVESLEVVAEADVSTDEGPFVFEVGAPDWLTTSDLEKLAEGGANANGVITSLLAHLPAQSALYYDDGDGQISDAERAAGAAAQGVSDGSQTDDTGSEETVE